MKAKPFEIMQVNDKVNISRGFQIDARIGSTKTAKLHCSCECCLMNTGCTDLLGSLEKKSLDRFIQSSAKFKYKNYVLPRTRNANPFGFNTAISGLKKLVSGLN